MGIYSVDGTTETLIKTAFTNVKGFYMFGDLPEGNYVVKAKVDVLV